VVITHDLVTGTRHAALCHHLNQRTQGEDMDILAAVETSYDRLGKLASAIGPDQLDAPTPLPGWDIRTLLDHTLGFVTAMTDCANGAPMAEQSATGIVQSDPVTAVRQTVFDSLAAWRRPGALEARTATPLGPMPGAQALALVIMETTIHGTDLARATGQDETVHPDVAADVLATLRAMPLDAIRAAGEFGPEITVPVDATPAQRILALTGRRP
jgi:uncharacterized protein (TIGR03086 family)